MDNNNLPPLPPMPEDESTRLDTGMPIPAPAPAEPEETLYANLQDQPAETAEAPETPQPAPQPTPQPVPEPQPTPQPAATTPQEPKAGGGMPSWVMPVVLFIVVAGAAFFLTRYVISCSNRVPAEVDSITVAMVKIEGGTFKMGATEEQGTDIGPDEKPVHEVTVGDFQLCNHEVTVAEWKAIMDGECPCPIGKGQTKEAHNMMPVVGMTWAEAQTFIQKLNEVSGKKFRLPTEAEWEYAARGGKLAKPTKFAGSDKIGEVAWYAENADQQTNIGRMKKPNELGLFDMSGNVWEWCNDGYGEYPDTTLTNPQGIQGAPKHVLRGGAWDCNPRNCRVAFRDSGDDKTKAINVGLRLAQ